VRRPRTLIFLLLLTGAAASADSPKTVPQKTEPPKGEAAAVDKPWFVDDEKYFAGFMSKLKELAKDGKCLAHDQLVERRKSGTKPRLAFAKPADQPLTPEEVYRKALPSVFVVGSVHKNKMGEWHDGLYATAWAGSSNGILVTSWHVFEDLDESEVFGAVDQQGKVYPVVDFLGGDKVADVAFIKIEAEGLTPLPVAPAHARVGAWVGVLGHPGDNYFVFTQGHVSRYSTNKNDDDKRERWMGVTAEYAGGSSGSPVLDRFGSVVGMAALTLTIDGGPPAGPARRRLAEREPPKKAPPPRNKDMPEPGPKEEVKPIPPASVQMVLKMAVPGPTLHKLVGK
jgi:S1-C subfamily serine protease